MSRGWMPGQRARPAEAVGTAPRDAELADRRYADDFVIPVHSAATTPRPYGESRAFLHCKGLRLSAANTLVGYMSEGLGFLGFRIQWRSKRGTSK